MSSATAKRTNSSSSDSADNMQAAKAAAREAYDNLLDAKEKFKSAAREAGLDARDTTSEKLEETLEKTQDKAFDAYENTSNYIIDRPLTSAGIAFATGFIIAKLVEK